MNGYIQYREDLQDYLDERLDTFRKADIDAYLIENRDAAEHVATLKSQSEALKRLGAIILDEPVPDKLRAIVRKHEQHKISPSRLWSRKRFLEVAAATLIFLSGGSAGWWLHDRMTPLPTPVEALLENSSYALNFYGSDSGFPIGFSPDQSKELANWIKKLFGKAVPYPDLSADNYQFSGGNILPGADSKTIFYLYSRSKNLHISVIAWASDEEPSEELTVAELGDFAASYWYSGNFGYAVLGSSSDDGLGHIADSIYKFYEETGTKG